MADTSLYAYTSKPVEESPKRRKLRKGTQSCWECKRRKIKCTLRAPHDTTCDGCKRRGTLCVSQEHPDISTSRSSRHYADRLCRVEGLVEQLVKNADTCIHSRHTKLSPGRLQDFEGQLRSSTPNDYSLDDVASKEDLPIAAYSTTHALESTVKPIQETERRLSPSKLGIAQSSLRIASASTRSALTSQFEEIRSKLIAAWPNERNLNLILSIPVDTTRCFHCLIFSSRTAGPGQKTSPRDVLQLPGLDPHPVLIARKLLILGSYLQAFPSSGIRSLTDLGVHYYDVMSQAVETAHSLVQCNEEFIGSIEGIECIMIASMYLNNAGNLRHAWLSLRRALTVAQMMGLHRTRHPASIKTLDPNTGANPEHVWFRLIQFDRYLSLMLGLPQYVSESIFATPDALQACTPIERMQRIDCAATALILERNEANINDMAATQEIDKMLRKAAASMPSQWWLIPSLAPDVGHEMESSSEINRMYDQLAHYHSVARLHLPYLLRYSATGKYDYSKITAVNASREVLARFIAFRSSSPTQSYCRGTDFLMFLACTTLCLAHMNAQPQGYVHACYPEEGSAFSFLAHQRPTDRGMMERALESMQQMARHGEDLIASRIATTVQNLLEMEGDSAHGGNYSASASSSCGEELECGGNLSNEGNVLQIQVPSFGIIKIERGGTLRSGSTRPFTHAAEIPAPAVTQPPHSEATMSLDMSSTNADPNESFAASLDFDAEDWTLQGVDMAFFDSLMRGSDLDAEMS